MWIELSTEDAEVLKTLVGNLSGRNERLRQTTDRLWHMLEAAGVPDAADDVLDRVLNVAPTALRVIDAHPHLGAAA